MKVEILSLKKLSFSDIMVDMSSGHRKSPFMMGEKKKPTSRSTKTGKRSSVKKVKDTEIVSGSYVDRSYLNALMGNMQGM